MKKINKNNTTKFTKIYTCIDMIEKASNIRNL